MSSEAITVHEKTGSDLVPMSVSHLKRQISLIQDVMREVMKDGTHFGVVPGCGDKKALLKPGAEKLAFTFRLAPEFEVFERELANGHREYRVHCTIKQIGTGVILGGGVGSASTMEGKYRFRTGPVKETGKPVPKIFWDIRATDPKRAQEMLGGAGYSVKKVNGQWEIVEVGEKVEHDNPADYYNTVLKMAKKRAQIDATLTCTAASDIFTQDTYDDFDEETPAAPEPRNVTGTAAPSPAPVTNRSQPKETEKPAGESAPNEPANGAAVDWRSVRIHFGKAKDAKLGEIPTTNLMWWINNFIPKGYNGRPPGKDDVALRAALDAAKAELHANKDRQDAGHGEGDPTQDDIPY